MQAIVLAEACLAVGLPARTVGLHPLSPYDMDQHYVTVVWAGPSAGWVLLDPSFGTCFKDPDRTILSPWKLRARFAEEEDVSGAPSDFGDDPQRAAADYREYVAKSILYLLSPGSAPRAMPASAGLPARRGSSTYGAGKRSSPRGARNGRGASAGGMTHLLTTTSSANEQCGRGS